MSETKEKELEILHYFSSLLSRIFDFEELLGVLVEKLSRHFCCKRISILLLNEEGFATVKLAKGFSKEEPLVKNLQLDNTGPISKKVIRGKKSLLFKVKSDWEKAGLKIGKDYKTFAFLAIPIINNDEVKGIINIAEPEKKRSFSKEDQRMLEIIAAKIGLTLETIALHKKIVKQEIYRNELEIGRNLQLSLLPAGFCKTKKIEISHCSFPALLVGGDYYEFINLGKNKVALAVGDISGKGVSASIIMSSLRALVRAFLPKKPDNLPEVIREINSILYEDLGKGHYFTTLVLCVFDFNRMRMNMINAGHNYPLLKRRGIEDAIELFSGSTNFLGSFEELKLEEIEIPIFPSDTLLFYTDGLTENRNPENELYGEDQIKKSFDQAAKSDSAVKIKENMLNNFRKFINGNELQDDYTIVIAKIL